MNNKRRDSALVAPSFLPLPLGSIRPTGWLLNQLRIQADGLSGHLDEFWPDVAESGWIGGNAEVWERGPYWLDGIGGPDAYPLWLYKPACYGIPNTRSVPLTAITGRDACATNGF